MADTTSGPQAARGIEGELAERFAACDWVDDPFLGPVVVDVFAARSPVRPGAPRWAAVEQLRTVVGGGRRVDEVAYVPVDGGFRVPVAVVWDDTTGDRVARVYYNKTFLGGEGADRVRPPVLRPDPELRLHPVMAAYGSALHRADGPGLLAVLDPRFRWRRPDGAYLESDDARADFVAGMVASGGVPIEYVTSTDDGTCAANEFISWRTAPHAGLGVYERSPAGLVSEFRSYEGPVYPKPGTAW